MEIHKRTIYRKFMGSNISGNKGLGVIYINEDNKCKWGCLDVDDYLIDIEKNLWQFVKKNLLVCR